MSDNKPLFMAPAPCTTCPYRRDTPTGIWDRSEYEKLPAYDNREFGATPVATFHCHQEKEIGKPTVCRGWLSVHPDCLAVRLARCSGLITREQMAEIPIKPDPALYSSGTQAFREGIKGIKRPGKKARVAIEKLTKRREASP